MKLPFFLFFLYFFANGAPFDQCENGWIYTHTSCYFVSNYVVNWKTAREACKQAESNLFVINSKQELYKLMKLINPPSGIYYWVIHILIPKSVLETRVDFF